jgi:hypothetical protein
MSFQSENITQVTSHESMVGMFQDVFRKMHVADAITNRKYESAITMGDRVSVPGYVMNPDSLQSDYGTATAIDYGTFSDFKDTIEVTHEKISAKHMPLGTIEKMGVANIAERIAFEMSQEVSSYIDGIVLGETVKANAYILNNGSGTPTAYTTDADKATKGALTVSTTNVDSIARAARNKVMSNLRATTALSLISIVDREYLTAMEAKFAAKEVDYSPEVLKNGLINSPVAGFRCYESYNLTNEYTLQVSGAVTADETIVISAGEGADLAVPTVTFTAKASPSAAGEFDVAASATLQADAIVNAINNVTESGVSVGFSANSASEKALKNYYRVSAEKVVDGSDIYVRVYFKSGIQTLDVSGATNVAQTRTGTHLYFGLPGAISMVALENPTVTRAGVLSPTNDTRLYSSRFMFGVDVLRQDANKFVTVLKANS